MKIFKPMTAKDVILCADERLKGIPCRASGLTRRLATTILLIMVILVGCKKDISKPPEVAPIITNTVDVKLPTDPGEVGLVIDTREIFRKGYVATKAEVKFPDMPGFNRTLDIDSVLNIAILRIPNDSLTDAQKAAFAAGVTTNITIMGEGQELAQYSNKQVLDNTGEPLIIPAPTGMKQKILPVKLKEGIAYYVQPEKVDGEGSFPAGGVLEMVSNVLYDFQLPITGLYLYKYYVKPVSGSENAYYILRSDDDPQFTPKYYFYVNSNGYVDVTVDQTKALKFVFEQDADGWARIQQAGTSKYLTIVEGTSSSATQWKALVMKEGTGNRFRLISADITWSGEDRGTVYQQPIMPPSTIEFAYQSTIKNCSLGALSETVGVTKSRTSTRTIETTESLELFASKEVEVGVKVGAEAGVSIPGAGDVKATVEISANHTMTTTATTSTGQKLTGEQTELSEVSRTRTIDVPPHSGVEVYDAVRVVKNARVPFTQVLRIKATYSDGTPLTGAEIRTQMMFNFVSGLPITTGDDYVDVSLRGNILINEMFNTETGAKDIPDACN